MGTVFGGAVTMVKVITNKLVPSQGWLVDGYECRLHFQIRDEVEPRDRKTLQSQ